MLSGEKRAQASGAGGGAAPGATMSAQPCSPGAGCAKDGRKAPLFLCYMRS